MECSGSKTHIEQVVIYPQAINLPSKFHLKNVLLGDLQYLGHNDFCYLFSQIKVPQGSHDVTAPLVLSKLACKWL